MTRRRHRPRRRVPVGLAPLALVAVVALSQVDRGPRHLVAVPSSDASPVEVVEAYVTALDAHDDATATRLLAPAVRADDTHRWLDEVDHVSHLSVGKVSPQPPKWSARNTRIQVISVPVTFTVQWRSLHPDPHLPEGRSRWGYLLSRRSDDSPWRIFAQGTR